MRVARLRDLRTNSVGLFHVEEDGTTGVPLAVAVPGYENEHRLEKLLRLGRLEDVLARQDADQLDLSGDHLEWLPPVQDPRVIVCAGQNFAAHATESSVVGTPTRPSAFLRVPRTIAGNHSRLNYPSDTEQLDYEVEVAAVIGSDAVDVSADSALTFVAGLCLANDISARDIQFDEAAAGSMLLGKNLPNTLPLGPWLTTMEEITAVDDIEMSLTVNGHRRQHDNLHGMTLKFPELISYWSALGFRAGDLVLSGTPVGIGIFLDPVDEFLLRPGDVVTCSSPQLGQLTTTITAPTSERKIPKREDQDA